MGNDVTALRNSGVSDVQRSSHAIVWSLIASGIVIVVAGFILAVLLRLMVRNPVARLAERVRQVAAGDYNQTVDVAGPPEVASLGADVEEMRHRIVADLRVVQAANDAVERANAELGSANARLESQAVDLQRSNQDLEQFAYVASHDLQEPLRKVASFCQLLQRRYAGQLDERADQYISFAVDGAHRMQRLINDLLKFSRIGRVTSDFTDVNLGAVVAAAAEANDDAAGPSGRHGRGARSADGPGRRGAPGRAVRQPHQQLDQVSSGRYPGAHPGDRRRARRRVADHVPRQRHRDRPRVRGQGFRDFSTLCTRAMPIREPESDSRWRNGSWSITAAESG